MERERITGHMISARRIPLFRCLPLIAGIVSLIVAVSPVAAIETVAREAVLIDVATDAVLFEKDSDTLMPPASMSKMMTANMVFERLRDGRLSLDDTFLVSRNAWRKGGAKSGSSTMFLEPGKRVKVEDLLRGIIIQSGGDACIVVAEGLASSEEEFAQEMTLRGRELGLLDTTFTNATGWPDPDHLTTARDLARLAKHTIREFPEFYRIYSEKSFTYNGIRQGNRNPLLYKNMGADGLKTGHTKAAGYGLTATAVRGDRRLILVVNGLTSVKARSREAQRLMEWGFREFNNYALFKGGEVAAEAEVWLGQEAMVPLVVEKGLLITLPRKARRQMKVTVTYDGPIPAPIAKGDKLAKLVISAPGVDPIEMPLLAGADVQRLGFLGRFAAALKYILWGASG
jgi:serine-type D-Ala-D-Ala carboxypeptidase (penicillin-binding protein 5/6)